MSPDPTYQEIKFQSSVSLSLTVSKSKQNELNLVSCHMLKYVRNAALIVVTCLFSVHQQSKNKSTYGTQTWGWYFLHSQRFNDVRANRWRRHVASPGPQTSGQQKNCFHFDQVVSQIRWLISTFSLQITRTPHVGFVVNNVAVFFLSLKVIIPSLPHTCSLLYSTSEVGTRWKNISSLSTKALSPSKSYHNTWPPGLIFSKLYFISLPNFSFYLPIRESFPASFSWDCSNVSMSVLHCSTVNSLQFCSFWIKCSSPWMSISLPSFEYLK